MGGGYYSFEKIPDLVESGKLSQDDVDTAVSRVLHAKFSLGLFENPYTGVADDEIDDYINTESSRKVAQDLNKKIDEGKWKGF